jgi:hypothetical protein
MTAIVVGALGFDAQAQTYAAQVSCTSGPYRMKLPQSYKAVRGIGHLKRERVLRIAGPLRVGAPANAALRGLLRDPPKDGEVEFTGDTDSIRINLARGRVFDVEYSCSAE